MNQLTPAAAQSLQPAPVPPKAPIGPDFLQVLSRVYAPVLVSSVWGFHFGSQPDLDLLAMSLVAGASTALFILFEVVTLHRRRLRRAANFANASPEMQRALADHFT